MSWFTEQETATSNQTNINNKIQQDIKKILDIPDRDVNRNMSWKNKIPN